MVAQIHGAARGTGGEYVDDKREHLEIWVDKQDAEGLPYQYHTRVSINLFVGSSKYQAGLRSKPKTPYVWICSDLQDARGQTFLTTLAVIFGALAALIPARQAAQLEIIRALRYE